MRWNQHGTKHPPQATASVCLKELIVLRKKKGLGCSLQFSLMSVQAETYADSVLARRALAGGVLGEEPDRPWGRLRPGGPSRTGFGCISGVMGPQFSLPSLWPSLFWLPELS